MKRADVVIFDPPVSDIPGSELAGLSEPELRQVFEGRFRTAGQPYDKLKGWLNDHYVGHERAAVEKRLLMLDWYGWCSLLLAANDWVDEAVPPRSDLS